MNQYRRKLPYLGKKIPIQVYWEREDTPVTVRGVFREISRDGALALTSEAPPEGTPVMVGPEGKGFAGWVEGAVTGVTEVIGLSLDRWTSYLVRLEFIEACPDEFLMAMAEDFKALPIPVLC